MDVNNNRNTTSPPPSSTNEDKNHDGGGVKAPKRGRPSSKVKSAPLAEEEVFSPPQKKPANEVSKGMEEEKRAIFQSTSTEPPFYNNHHNSGYGIPHPPRAYYGHPSWSPLPSAPPSSPAPVPAIMMLSPSPFPNHKFGWFGPPPIPVATSTPLNPAYVCSTSSQQQIDSSMMDAQKEASGELSGEAENEQSLTKRMWDTTAMRNTNMDLSNYWTSISMEDLSNAKNGPTSSGSISTADSLPRMPITPKPRTGITIVELKKWNLAKDAKKPKEMAGMDE